jgi:hypothetical protein
MAYSPQPYPQPRRRPIGVTLLAILLILVGILAVIISLLVVFLGFVFFPVTVTGFVGLALSAVLVITSFLVLAAGFALLSLRPWAWWLAVIVLFLYLLTQVSVVLSGGGIGLVTVIIPALILVYLLAVRKHFR